MKKIINLILCLCVGTSTVGGYYVPDVDEELFDQLVGNEVVLNDEGEGETWKGAFMAEKMPFNVTLNIERVGCWDGAFKGTGTMMMKVSLIYTLFYKHQ